MIASRTLLTKQSNRAFSFVPVELKPLPYELSALEPVISGKLLDYHYNKHHKNYVKNLNILSEQAQEALAT